MKKLLLLFALPFSTFSMVAQNSPIDFEASGNGASWTWTVFENDTNPDLEIIANPDATGINTSATVAKFTALQAGQPFAGCDSQHGSDIGTFSLTPSTSTIKIMVWKSVISDVGIKLVDASSASLGEIKVANTLTDQWEEISFDFSSMEGIVYDQIVIFPDFDARTSDNVIYFDNITFGDLPPLAAPMIAAPDPTTDPANVISLFSDVYTDVPVDSWQTTWSMADLTDLQIAGNDTKRYQSLDFVGIETVGPNLIDATAMEYFHIDIWTPNMTTFKVKLVDFGADGNFGGGDDSEHEIIYDFFAQNTWISYQIPLANFTGLASREHMAQLILSGSPVGGGTVYVDNVYFSSISTNVADLEVNKIALFPNPAQDQVVISSDQIVKQVKVYNLSGALLMDVQVSENVSTIDVAHLPKGMYHTLVIMDDFTAIKQFVKQ